jgi:BolA protein
MVAGFRADKACRSDLSRTLTERDAHANVVAMTVADRIRTKLSTLDPVRLAIFDDSHRHRGHVGARPEGETHFRVEIVAAGFAGKSRLERQRAVYALLAEEMADRVHALQISALTPDEDHAKPSHPV